MATSVVENKKADLAGPGIGNGSRSASFLSTVYLLIENLQPRSRFRMGLFVFWGEVWWGGGG